MSDHFEERRSNTFESCPKYIRHELAEDQILLIAKKAVLLAKDEVYKDVGKSVTSKFFYVVGVCAVGIYSWLHINGYIKG
jgi:hypothetical protein